jgi:hypothetical protein
MDLNHLEGTFTSMCMITAGQLCHRICRAYHFNHVVYNNDLEV